MNKKLYLNADGHKKRIVPMWVESNWQRKLWCFFRGHTKPYTVSMTDRHGNVSMSCGICCKILQSNLGISPSAHPDNPAWDSKSWLWNGEPVTWYEFCDRLEGKK